MRLAKSTTGAGYSKRLWLRNFQQKSLLIRKMQATQTAIMISEVLPLVLRLSVGDDDHLPRSAPLLPRLPFLLQKCITRISVLLVYLLERYCMEQSIRFYNKLSDTNLKYVLNQKYLKRFNISEYLEDKLWKKFRVQ